MYIAASLQLFEETNIGEIDFGREVAPDGRSETL